MKVLDQKKIGAPLRPGFVPARPPGSAVIDSPTDDIFVDPLEIEGDEVAFDAGDEGYVSAAPSAAGLPLSPEDEDE